MIEIKDISVSFDEKKVLSNINLSLQKGLIHGLVGLNGAGKTTLLNVLYGFIKPKNGEIIFENRRLKRNQVAFLEATNFFYSNITGKEYLQIFPHQNKSFDLNSWQDLFHLPLDELVENYSTGMKKKLALLGILQLDKPILILDEPFNGLDLETSKILEILVRELKNKGKTIIITSHILETLTNSCNFIHFLVNGQIQRTYPSIEFTQLNDHLFKDFEQRITEVIKNTV